jgi:hypothetical protein
MNMNFNVAGADTIVSEYLLYRGFTQSFQCLEVEKGRDRTKKFEVTKIVDVRALRCQSVNFHRHL